MGKGCGIICKTHSNRAKIIPKHAETKIAPLVNLKKTIKFLENTERFYEGGKYFSQKKSDFLHFFTRGKERFKYPSIVCSVGFGYNI
ncbi:MAG TPA: hypothetical protein VJI13_04990 [Candidatus Norongarragalinales archaeon]|nr:hypothetical protein [Candidatus Norongarragalinales archaeon]